MGEYQPVRRLVQVMIRNDAGAIARRFVPGAGAADFPRSRHRAQRVQQRFQAASRIQHIVDHQQTLRVRQLRQQPGQAVNGDPVGLCADAGVRADPYREVLASVAAKGEVLVYRNRDRGAAAPDAEDEIGNIAAGMDLHCQTEAGGEQRFGADEHFVHGCGNPINTGVTRECSPSARLPGQGVFPTMAGPQRARNRRTFCGLASAAYNGTPQFIQLTLPG